LAGVTWKWLEANEQRDRANAHARDQAVQQAVRSREVHDALARASALREQARVGGEQGKWAEAREEARRAAALAEGGPVGGGGARGGWAGRAGRRPLARDEGGGGRPAAGRAPGGGPAAPGRGQRQEELFRPGAGAARVSQALRRLRPARGGGAGGGGRPDPP